jgi:HAD superfamily hydrolase (TIGR01509 family)
MDGTLTHAVHDFNRIRERLGVPAGRPILEYLDTLPRHRAFPLHEKLLAIEHEHVEHTRCADGARPLLTLLQQQHCRMGIVTRNARDVALATLAHCGLADFFSEDTLITRESAPPKPDPAGIHQLLNLWSATPADAVMIGDYDHDLTAGRRAGTHTIYVDPTDSGIWSEGADLTIKTLSELCRFRS